MAENTKGYPQANFFLFSTLYYLCLCGYETLENWLGYYRIFVGYSVCMYIHTSIPIIRYIFFWQFGAVVKTIQTITNKLYLHNGNDKANTRTGDGKQPRNIHRIT